MEVLACLAPLASIHESVELGNAVVHRTPGVAEGNSTIHAAGRLPYERLFRVRNVDFREVLDPLGHRTMGDVLASMLEESLRPTHTPPPSRE
jgi:hypothetical protein